MNNKWFYPKHIYKSFEAVIIFIFDIDFCTCQFLRIHGRTCLPVRSRSDSRPVAAAVFLLHEGPPWQHPLGRNEEPVNQRCHRGPAHALLPIWWHHRRHQHGAEHPAPPLQRQGARPHEQPLVVRLRCPSLRPNKRSVHRPRPESRRVLPMEPIRLLRE